MSLTLEIKYRPHKGQQNFHNSKARFRLLACGRRWGKTISGANEAIKVACQTPRESVGFCVAPTYWHTQKQLREFMLYCPRQLIEDVSRSEHKVTLLGNRQIWFRSADNPDSLRSEGLDWLWGDEGGQWKQEAWTLALRPALMDKKGIAWFTGTPKGKNWYFQLWTRGQDPEQTDYQSWSYSSLDNPYLDPKEIEEFARDMPDMAYRQEILAEFIDEIGSVFRNVESCISGDLEEPTTSKQYVMGADLAKHQDFTVLTVLDQLGHLVAFDRFSQLDWVFQRKRIVNLCRKYGARLLVDSSGVGDPMYDELRRENIRVEGFKFTQASKKDLIENLSMMIDNGTISYPRLPVLINELGMYGYTVGSTGLIRYGAPEGLYDDCVISLALGAFQLSRPRRSFGSVGRAKRRNS